MDYPFTPEVLEVCECTRPIKNRYVQPSISLPEATDQAKGISADCVWTSYKFSHLSYIRQALSYSTKTSLRTDSSGILSMQFMIMNTNATKASEGVGAGFVEFTVSAGMHPLRRH